MWIVFSSAGVASIKREPDFQPGIIQYVRFQKDFHNPSLYSKILVIKLDSYDHEHYTSKEHLFPFLIDVQTCRNRVTLHTTSCDSGDHGFDSFTIYTPE